MMPLDATNNPFAVLTAVAAPAILTNACSVLALGTSNRIARVVDRTRVVVAQKLSLGPQAPGYDDYVRQLDKLRERAQLLIRALRLFYTALAMFAGTALIAIVGSVLVAFEATAAFHMAAIFGIIIGTVGVLAITVACAHMVRETRLAIHTLTDEHAAALASAKAG